jgi:hypothetical protein
MGIVKSRSAKYRLTLFLFWGEVVLHYMRYEVCPTDLDNYFFIKNC